MRRLLVEKARRQIEGLRLYEPLAVQEQFHVSRVKQRILRGSNRGGKTLPAAVEFARAVTGQDPNDKFPKTGGRAWAVGKNLDHCGETMWRKLGRAGAFKIIRDDVTGDWRSYRPWLESDRARVSETRLSPPLIPPRLIKKIAWENKAKGIPKKITLHNGWEINFYSSEGKPPVGADVDIVWFDEEIIDADWHPEMMARLFDRHGLFIWSATPQAGTDQLFELHERAERERLDPDKGVEEFIILLRDNKHFTEAEIRELAGQLTDEQQRVRIEGEFLVQSFKMYPEFSALLHVEPYREIPPHWCRYAVVDPGHQICAVLFGAVPPPDAAEGDTLWLYDEAYIQYCDAGKFGDAMRLKCSGQSFEAFIIDGHAGRTTQIGAGKTVEQQYAEELKRHNLKSRSTGFGFRWGSDDVDAGVLAVRNYLRMRETKGPKLRVLGDRMANFMWEIKRYHKKRVHGVMTDRPDQKKDNHLMDCLRYLCILRPRYRKPEKVRRPLSGAKHAFNEIKKRRRELLSQTGDYSGVRFGPVGNVRD